LQAIGEHIALQCKEFEAIRRAALNRDIVVIFGWLLGVRPTTEEIFQQRTKFLEERKLESPEAITEWLRSNALSERDLGEYLAQEAICVRLRRWARTARSFDRGCNSLLNEMRILGMFPEWARAAAEEEAIITAYRDQPEYREIENELPSVLAGRHAAHTGIQVTGNIREWAEDAGFDSVEELIDALKRMAIYNDVKGRIARLMEIVEQSETAYMGNGGSADG
jgi:hypothetical protein